MQDSSKEPLDINPEDKKTAPQKKEPLENQTSQTSPKPESQPINIVVTSPPDPHRTSEIKAIKIGIFIDIILAIITVALFFVTLSANKISKDSLELAQQTLLDSKKNDSINRINKAIADSLDNIRRNQDYIRDTTNTSINNRSFLVQSEATKNSAATNKKTIDLATNSLNQQSQSLKEEQRQFEIANMPYLEIADVGFITFEVGKELVIKFRLENLGNHPAKIINAKFATHIDTGQIPVYPFRQILNLQTSREMIEMYVTKGTSKLQTLRPGIIVSKEMYDGLKKDDLYIIFFGEVTYLNQVNHKERTYNFNIWMHKPTMNEYITIKSTNVDRNP